MEITKLNLSRFDFTSIRLAVLCAQTENLTHAARECHLVLPAASRRIRELEVALGTQLFERHSRGLKVTPAGKVFMRRGLTLLQELEGTIKELNDLDKGVVRHIQLFAGTAAISQFLPPLIAKYSKKYPEIQIDLEEGVSEQVVLALKTGKAEMGVFVEGTNTDGFDAQVFRSDELVLILAYAKANPNKLNYASSGNGSIQHIAGELFKQMTSTSIQHIPYKGAGPAVQDLLGGQVDLFFTTPASVVNHIKADKLKGLVVTSSSRLTSLPHVPTSREADLKEFAIDSWFALYAPAGTSSEIVNQINTEIAKILAMPEIKKKAEDAGTVVDHMNPSQLDEYTRKELEYWGRVIQSAKITAE